MDEKRKNVLDGVLKGIEKQYGKGAIMYLGDEVQADIPVIPSGAISLDIALGIGGYPRGRIVEIYGPEASGKTTLAMHAVAEVQKRGGAAAYIDAEHAFDITYAKKLGIQVETLIVSQPDFGEQALEIAETLVRSNAVDVVVIDSVAALVPRSEIEGEMGDSQVGVQARLMSQALRKLTGAVSKSKTCLIFINQLRMKIGVMFGNPETTTGGNALKFYSSIRIDVRRIANIKEHEEVVGAQVKAKVIKNKMFPPFREAIFDITFGKGIDRLSDLVGQAEKDGIIQKSGSWYSYGDERLGQGAVNVAQTLREKPELLKGIVAKVKELHNLKADVEPVEEKKEKENAPKGKKKGGE